VRRQRGEGGYVLLTLSIFSAQRRLTQRQQRQKVTGGSVKWKEIFPDWKKRENGKIILTALFLVAFLLKSVARNKIAFSAKAVCCILGGESLYPGPECFVPARPKLQHGFSLQTILPRTQKVHFSFKKRQKSGLFGHFFVLAKTAARL